MGRPKKSDLLCTFCNKAFLKKINLEEHMKSHIDMNDSRQSRACSNLCSICQESFEDSEYKLHIQTEHQHELNKMITGASDKDLFSYESGYVLVSKKRIKKESDAISSADSKRSSKRSKFQNKSSLNIAPANIKLEPGSGGERRIITPKKKIVMKLKTPSIKCHLCGLLCKGQKGLRIHQSTHRRTHETSSDTSQSDNQEEIIDKRQKSEPSRMNSAIENDGNLSGLMYMLPNPISNPINVGNQSNLQFLTSPANENIQMLEVIPKFDSISEKYVEWLKIFIHKCKKDPLSSVMCQNINYVVNEISSCIGFPMGSLKRKSNHFYFMKMYKTLAKIILNHMR